MKYRSLGNSILQVSEISFGCMSLGNNDKENSLLIQDAYEKGINLFDTADLYQHGQNEETVGKALQGFRDKVYLATKVGNQWKSNGKEFEWKPSKDYILKAIDESLKRLNTDYVDLYQLHGGTLDDPIDEIIEAFEILQAQGKIRYYGLSSIRPNVIRTYIKKSQIRSVMTQYSLLDRRPEEETLQLLQANSIGVLARGSIAQGLLIDKPSIPYLGHGAEQVMEIRELVKQLAKQYNYTPLEVAVKYVLNSTAITSAVVGIRNTTHLKEIIELYSKQDLHLNELNILRSEIQAFKYEQHR